MSDSIQYHQLLPENNKSSFVEFDNVDYVLSFEGRALNLGSVRLEGVFDAQYNNLPLSSNDVVDASAINTKDIKLDPLVGAHSVCESWTCEFSGNIVENITSYPRYVKMASAATSGVDDMNNASAVCELKAPFPRMTNMLLQGPIGNSDGTNQTKFLPDFSIRPSICVNSGRGLLPYSKSGDIRLTVTLARNFAVLYGLDVNSQVDYKLRDLRLVYTTAPEPKEMEPVMMRTKLNIKQSVQSRFANVQTKVPAVCSAVSCSFQVQDRENTATNNNLELNKVPLLTQTQFLFNDSTNTLISYLIKNNVEVTGRFIDSFVDTGRNALSTNKLADNNGFGVGLNFGDEPIDLSNQKFSIQLTSGISSASPMVIYMYFHSMIQL